MSSTPKQPNHDPQQPGPSAQARTPLPRPSEAGLKPAEYGQYGMRADAGGGHGSDHGAASDHESFDGEYRTREMRDHRARSIPTGLSDAPEAPATDISSDAAKPRKGQ